jgi:uncharacterized membrane protein YkoI
MQPTIRILILVAAVLVMPLAAAQDPPVSFELVQESEEREREPAPADLAKAIEIAVEHTGGEAAGAETVEREGRQVHEIKVLLDDGSGSVQTVTIDPETGAIIPQERPQR